MGADHVPHKVDAWGCEWVYPIPGLDGQVVGHPLADWAALENWQPPEPVADPERIKALAENRAQGKLATLGLEHGFLFMRLFYLRGFDAMALDAASQEPLLKQLIDTITSYWERYTQPFLRAGIDLLVAGDDLGTQTASILGPSILAACSCPPTAASLSPRASPAHTSTCTTMAMSWTSSTRSSCRA